LQSLSLLTQVTQLAFQNSTSGAVQISNTGGMTLAKTSGLASSFNNGGAVTLTANAGFLTFAANLSSSGNLKVVTTENPSEVPGAPEENITVNKAITVQSTHGGVNFTAGDGISLLTGSLVKGAVGGVSLNFGVGDTDHDAKVTLQGSIEGSPVLVNGKSPLSYLPR